MPSEYLGHVEFTASELRRRNLREPVATVTLRVDGPYRVRRWVALLLLRAGYWLLGYPVEVE